MMPAARQQLVATAMGGNAAAKGRRRSVYRLEFSSIRSKFSVLCCLLLPRLRTYVSSWTRGLSSHTGLRRQLVGSAFTASGGISAAQIDVEAMKRLAWVNLTVMRCVA